MTPWQILGLDSTADQRTIKRRYAQLLKTHRPDSDPEGFQRLRQAYEWLLDYSNGSLVNVTEPAIHLYEAPLKPDSEVEIQAAPKKVCPPLTKLTEFESHWHQASCTTEKLALHKELLRRCLDAEPHDVELIDWGVRTLGWLTATPLAPLSPDHQRLLLTALIDYRLERLCHRLHNEGEVQFVQGLKQLCQAPWLQTLDHREVFAEKVFELISVSEELSCAAIDKVCQLFGWDDKQGYIPQPEALWHNLMQRCAADAFWAEVRQQAESPRKDDKSRAAWLFLQPMTWRVRLWSNLTFKETTWEACAILSDKIESHHPKLIQRLPKADAYFWQDMAPRKESPTGGLWAWVNAFLLLLIPITMGSGSILISTAALFFIPLWILWIGKILLRAWAPITAIVAPLDYWLSERLLPGVMHSDDRKLLLLRHVVPRAIYFYGLYLCAGIILLAYLPCLAIFSFLHAKYNIGLKVLIFMKSIKPGVWITLTVLVVALLSFYSAINKQRQMCKSSIYASHPDCTKTTLLDVL